MSNNLFIKNMEDYELDLAPVKQYVNQTATYVQLKTGKTMEESIEIVKTMLKNHDTKNPVVTFNHRGDNGDVFVDTCSLSGYIDDNISKNYLVVPSLTVYEDRSKDKSLHSTYLEKNIANRNVNKKKAFMYKQEGDKVLYGRYNTLQKSMKINNNSLSGAYASISTILYNPSAHYSLTSTTRAATSIANAVTESMVAGNKHFRTPELVFNYILAVCNIINKEEVFSVVEKYSLHIPTTEELYKSIKRSFISYWSNAIMEKKIYDLIDTLDPTFKAAIMYSNDLYHFRTMNPELARDIIGSLASRVEDITDEPLTVLNQSEEFVLNLVHHVCADDIRGMKVNYKDMVGSKVLKVLGSTALNINLTFEKYSDLLKVFFRNDVMPISVSKIRDMLRKVTVLSDTDSTCASYGEWVDWFVGREEISSVATAISASVMSIASQVLEHKLRQYSANMNIPADLRSVISYKGEFFWTLFCNTPVAKHYHANVSIQEGNVFDEPDLEIKGVNLINSNAPMFVQKATKKMMSEIHEVINNNGKLDLHKFITDAANLERIIIDELLKGNIEILKSSKIKEASGYKLGPDKSPYIHHLFWEEVLKDKYGTIGEPPYTAVKIPTTLKSKKKMNDYLEKIKDETIKNNLINFLTKYDKESIGTFNLPLIYVGEHGVPEELIDAIDINRVVFDSLGAMYMILETISFSRKDGMKLMDLGY